MLENITPGSNVNVKIVKAPTNEAARKTLVRIISKDEDVRTENKRLKATYKANFNPQPRGGRLYSGRMPKVHILKGKIGEAGTVKATVDVINDLKSVARFIEVSAG
ncbi:hypothetical protein [Poriferisphaera sp. WC338]|uniref:hypothetical protein n=1 Tax=Poriferisphaera sp. WC338 TaxID=3425129 RepID=UPI003D8156E5